MQGGKEDEVEVLRCQINEWYPMFKPHTIRTLFHPLPVPSSATSSVSTPSPHLPTPTPTATTTMTRRRRSSFPDPPPAPTFESRNYTFDVYVTIDGRVKLIDFNPWRAFTLPLLFTWEELRKKHLIPRRKK
ncbi:hypothetical protein C4D60_Mb01t10880 [Musa balbisiana]|uniref:Cell division cycle protein 123 n=1 Tax=Musa balbisiana TaxID=52838 RepID=A0A4S8JLM8_MUSBA|nr:hypothetical protein C4D60_Mb01t10880 [Musa balbisiana]